MNNDLISREALRKCAIPCQIHNGALTDLCVPLYQIDNAPTVEAFTKEDMAGAYKVARMTNIICLCVGMFFGAIIGIVFTLVIIGDKL